MESDKPPQRTFKAVLLGDERVGKTSLMRSGDPTNSTDAQPTVGVDFRTHKFHIEQTLVKLQIWDIPGPDNFYVVKRHISRQAQAIVIVFDIMKRESFLNVPMLKDDARTCCHEQAMMVLVGNKCDLEDERKVSYVEASKFAEEQGMKYVECSAKTGFNVTHLFESLAREMNDKADQGLYPFDTTRIILEKPPDDKRPTICCYYM